MSSFFEPSIVSVPADRNAVIGGREGQKVAEQNQAVSPRELLASGQLGRVFGTDLIVSRILPDDTIFVLGEPEFVGHMPVRREVTADLRITGDVDRNMLYVDATMTRIGMGTATPNVKLHVERDPFFSGAFSVGCEVAEELYEEDFDWQDD